MHQSRPYGTADSTTDGFAGLSLTDVLDARDAYHVHLVRQRHVVATAVGRYLVRSDDDPGNGRPLSLAERLALPPGQQPARTLQNSSVRPWSWPCVLVFVDEWMDAEEIRQAPGSDGAAAALPARRADGADLRRVHPAGPRRQLRCHAELTPVTLSFPSALFGGGYVCLTQVQGQQRVGTIACLVSDGARTYALTNRHVAGQPGQPVTSLVGGLEVPIGVAAGRSVGRVEFEHAYPGLPARRAEIAVDAGLIEIDDLTRWTTQVFGIGQLGPVVDLGPETMDLRLVGQPVKAFGGASGPMRGEIAALFYRYRTRSGMEYLADAIVGPRLGPSHPCPPAPETPEPSGCSTTTPPTAASPPPPTTPHPLSVRWQCSGVDTASPPTPTPAPTRSARTPW